MKHIRIDETSNSYGWLKVLEFSHINKWKYACWKCLCDKTLGGCGNTHIVSGYLLRKGEAKSCGCRAHEKGSKAAHWQGGIKRDSNGRVYIYHNGHPYADKNSYVVKSHLMIEQFIGRFLKPGEVVHHINGDCTNDRISNLMLFPNQSEHRKFHCLPKYLLFNLRKSFI